MSQENTSVPAVNLDGKCDYCEGLRSPDELTCPHCGTHESADCPICGDRGYWGDHHCNHVLWSIAWNTGISHYPIDLEKAKEYEDALSEIEYDAEQIYQNLEDEFVSALAGGDDELQDLMLAIMKRENIPEIFELCDHFPEDPQGSTLTIYYAENTADVFAKIQAIVDEITSNMERYIAKFNGETA